MSMNAVELLLSKGADISFACIFFWYLSTIIICMKTHTDIDLYQYYIVNCILFVTVIFLTQGPYCLVLAVLITVAHGLLPDRTGVLY